MPCFILNYIIVLAYWCGNRFQKLWKETYYVSFCRVRSKAGCMFAICEVLTCMILVPFLPILALVRNVSYKSILASSFYSLDKIENQFDIVNSPIFSLLINPKPEIARLFTFLSLLFFLPQS